MRPLVAVLVRLTAVVLAWALAFGASAAVQSLRWERGTGEVTLRTRSTLEIAYTTESGRTGVLVDPRVELDESRVGLVWFGQEVDVLVSRGDPSVGIVSNGRVLDPFTLLVGVLLALVVTALAINPDYILVRDRERMGETRGFYWRS